MKPRSCRRCGMPSVYPPSNFDLSAMVCCANCGADQGSWRSIEACGGDKSTHQPRPKSELRHVNRIRSILAARIVFNRRCSTIECAVRDISATGARLLVSPHVAIPDEFHVEVPKKARTFRARLIWRRGEACGVRFV
jgi:PilZ domain